MHGLKDFYEENNRIIWNGIYLVLLLGYIAYLSYACYYDLEVRPKKEKRFVSETLSKKVKARYAIFLVEEKCYELRWVFLFAFLALFCGFPGIKIKWEWKL